MRVHLSMLIMSLCGSLVLCYQANAKEKESTETPYLLLWSQVEQLLAEREYGSAADLIADAETDTELAAFKSQLAMDRKDLAVLQQFAKLVKEQASALKNGATLKVDGLDYTVVEFVDDAKGERLVLTNKKSSAQIKKSLTELDARTWVELAESKLTSSADDRYMLGIFLASVSHGNFKDARQALNLAAVEGKSVTRWTARLDAATQTGEAAKTAKKLERDDPVIGTWRIVIGERGKEQWFFNSTFRSDGRVIHTPVNASEAAPPIGTWRQRGDGQYAVTFKRGGTAQLTMGPAKEGMRGNTTSGLPVQAIRQAKTKK